MATLAKRVITEPGAEDPRHYRQRVVRLAACYAGLFVGSLAGMALLVWKAQLFVGLAQRSNVETLTLGFFMVFFGYLAVLSAPGAWGAARVAGYHVRARLGGDWLELERHKMRALGPPRNGKPTALTNLVLEVEDRPGEGFEIPVRDAAGEMGRIRVDGARLVHHAAHKDGSNELLAYVVVQAAKLLEGRTERELDIVAWKSTDEEGSEQYDSLVTFARNLERRLNGQGPAGQPLGEGALWPKATLTREDCLVLEQRLAAICPALRDESFLPQWDYQGEHKLPVIPEPLGLVSLSRSEARVDPVSSMGCALLVVVAAVAILALFVLFPPWVPGS